MITMRFHLGLLLTGLLVALNAPAQPQTREILRLDTGWNLQSSEKVSQPGAQLSLQGIDVTGWYPVSVPTTVLAALIENGVYPDPYFGLNLRSIPGYQDGLWLVMKDDSPFDVPWWFRTEFVVPVAWAGRHLCLYLDGINFKANVWLNGRLIAGSDTMVGMFRRFDFEVTEAAQPGEMNVLAVEIIPPGQATGKIPRTKQIEATTGWDDHNPQPPDMNMGIWQAVYLAATGPVRLQHPYVATELSLPSLDMVRLTVSTYVENLTDVTQTVTVNGAIEGAVFSKEIAVGPGETAPVEFSPDEFNQLVVTNPRVWWPRPLGPQELYSLNLSCNVAGTVSDRVATRFGIRDITSVINEEGWRRFRVNGHDALVRGGAWMTSDMLLRLTHRRYDALVRYAAEANLNMLRSEGFSIRETDEFYDLCDQYGVMVTQQIFGRSIPDEDLAIACAKDTILRIRNHPSLVHFLGHDETFPTETLDAAYKKLIADFVPNRTYQPHSGAFEVEERFQTGGTRTGTRELWTYADPKHYYAQKEDGAWGFAQSGGIGGIVVAFDSARRMVDEKDLWPLWSDALSFHTVTQGAQFFKTVDEMLERRYGAASGIEEFCIKAQALNYECARGMFEAYARNKYSATGITTWKYDAAWPAFMTWAYIDWYLVATGAYYGAKTACRPIHIQYSYDDDSIWVVNSRYVDFAGLRAAARLYDSSGALVNEQEAPCTVASDEKTEVFRLERPSGLTKSHFLRLMLVDASGAIIDDNRYWLSAVPDIRGEVRDSWTDFAVNPKSVADHSDLSGLPPVRLETSVSTAAEGEQHVATVRLTNPSEHVAFFVRAAFHNGEDGHEVAPAFWDDNCLTLLPGESRVIKAAMYARDLGGIEPVLRLCGFNVRQ